MNIFVDKITENIIIITGQDVDHLRVRRHKAGHFFKIVEVQGDKYADAELIRLDKKEAEFKVKQIFLKKKKKAQITLYQAIIKKSNMEVVVQKAVELGVDVVVPVITERVSEKGKINKARLYVIAKEAAMQSERMEIPHIEDAVTFQEAMKVKNLFCLGERTRGITIKELMTGSDPCKNIAVLVGPEGGFSGKEFSILQDKSVPVVSFGESIMRSETSAIAALSVIRCFYLAE
jgi:16S rRNA (uracil1498-N3)-methyltransferase